MAARQSGPTSRFDFSSIGGIVLATAGILGGLILEGGEIADVRQATAALIVLGGTLGAVMVTTPSAILLSALRKLRVVFFEPQYSPDNIIGDILHYASRARRNGIVSLEGELNGIEHPFLRKALALGVDGTDVQELRKIMEAELDTEEQQGRAEAKVYEAAGGYAPTVGIIGAVLGLIQVMKHLEDISLVGHGIAVAFVATVYGVGVANLFFLPAGQKLKARLACSIRMKELMLEGALSIIQGMHPNVIEKKLEAFVGGTQDNSGKPQERKSSRAKAA